MPGKLRLIVLACALILSATTVAQADRVLLVAGGGDKGDGAPATEAQLHHPFGVDFDKSGTMFIVELEGGHVHRVDAKGIFSTIAGTGEEKGDAGDGGPARKATFNGMHSLAIAPDGDIYLADTWNNRVRKIDPSTGDDQHLRRHGRRRLTPATAARRPRPQFGGIYCVALESRRRSGCTWPTSTTAAFAWSTCRRASSDRRRQRRARRARRRRGARASAARRSAGRGRRWRGQRLHPRTQRPCAARRGSRRARFAPSPAPARPGPAGDDGAARQATLSGPKHLCVDCDGNVLIADTDNHVIRKYLPQGGQDRARRRHRREGDTPASAARPRRSS